MKPLNDVIRQFILSKFLPGESAANLRDHTPLQTSGILDSLATLELVAFLEREFDIELDLADTAVERFDRIEDIAACVLGKQRTQRRAPATSIA